MRIAVIGAGISGSLVARLLATQHDVVLFDANEYAGGHANTVDVCVDGKSFPVDTGFMVFNRRTYPNFSRLLEVLNVESQASEMSFSVRCARTGWEYQGSSLNGLFAQRTNCCRPSFLQMLRDIIRFNRLGTQAARDGGLEGRTVREFLTECGVGPAFTNQYLVPMAAAIWSSSPQAILDYPADFMIRFFANHGLMQLSDRPQWRTIIGGSREYVDALLKPIEASVRLRSPVAAVARTETEVIVAAADGPPETFHEVVFASHADQVLEMLVNPTLLEKQVLAAFPYRASRAVLHTDCGQLPTQRRAWASWNYHVSAKEQSAASVTYNLSRLQHHRSPTPILLTLNPTEDIDTAKIFRAFTYRHPGYSRDSTSAQSRFAEISGLNRTHYCGAYWGYGFHEDGVNSALAVAKHFGISLDECTAASTKEPSLITAAIR